MKRWAEPHHLLYLVYFIMYVAGNSVKKKFKKNVEVNENKMDLN